MADILQVNTELPADFTPTAPSGLTDEEAASRKPNISHHRPDKSTAQILAENLFTPFNGLNVALAACLALVGSWRNMLFLGVVVSNTLIGTVQELRARKTIRKLSLLNAPTAHVLRNGQEKTCAPDALVKGDLVILRAGDQVMADAVVTSGQGAANESLLTGESTPMRKQPGDFLLSGSYILEGTFTAQLVYVGDESYAARLTRSAKEIRRPEIGADDGGQPPDSHRQRGADSDWTAFVLQAVLPPAPSADNGCSDVRRRHDRHDSRRADSADFGRLGGWRNQARQAKHPCAGAVRH